MLKKRGRPKIKTPKTKVVQTRVTPEEYEELKEMAVREGYTSVSEFTRIEIIKKIRRSRKIKGKR